MANPRLALRETRSALKATPAWLSGATHTLLGSRFFVAVSALFFVAFLAHVTTAQTRFPPITRVSFSQIVSFAPTPAPAPDLPPEVLEKLAEARRAGEPAAQRYVEEGVGKVGAYYAAHPEAVARSNYVGLVVSGLFLMLALYMLARQEMRAPTRR